MKTMLERGREVPTAAEREELWRRLERHLPGTEGADGFARERSRSRRGALVWTGVVAAAAVTAALFLFLAPDARRTEETATVAAAPPGVNTEGDLASRIEEPPASVATAGLIVDSLIAAAAPPLVDSTRPATPDTARIVLRPSKPITSATPSGGFITGQVRNAEGRAIPYANVMVQGTAWGAMTNESGLFTIRHVPPGRYGVKVMCIGYGDESLVADVDAGRETWVDFDLEQKVAATMDLVEITAVKERIQLKSTGVRHGLEARQTQALPVDEMAEVTGLKAGVVARGGELHFRGGRAGEVQYQVDGVPVRDPAVGGSPSSEPRLHQLQQPQQPQSQPQAPEPPVIPFTGGTKLPNVEPYDAMFFEHYGVNPFLATEEDSLSTFAMDVDEASYTIARRYIELGHLPPKDAIRVEEFVNFFDQEYAPPDSGVFAIRADGAPSPFGPGYHLLRVGIKAKVTDIASLAPCDLVFVIDESGSMDREDRLELVKLALEVLLLKLRPQDRVGIVVYETTARVLLEPTPASDRAAILGAIRSLRPLGSTNAEHGLQLAYEMARRARRPGAITRLILCADGVANQGQTSAEGILDRVLREADEGIALTTVGFGMGNYNDVLMEKLADKGDGAYFYVDDIGEARRVFDLNLASTLETVAREAKVQVAFDPRSVARYRLLGFENRDVKDADFRNDRVDAGEIGPGHEVTALYEVKLMPEVDAGAGAAGPNRLATVRLRWATPEHENDGIPVVTEIAHPVMTSDLGESFDAAPARFRLDAAAAELAEILRGSYWAKESRIADMVPLANRLAAELADDPAVLEFRDLVTKAAGLQGKPKP